LLSPATGLEIRKLNPLSSINDATGYPRDVPMGYREWYADSHRGMRVPHEPEHEGKRVVFMRGAKEVMRIKYSPSVYIHVVFWRWIGMRKETLLTSEAFQDARIRFICLARKKMPSHWMRYVPTVFPSMSGVCAIAGQRKMVSMESLDAALQFLPHIQKFEKLEARRKL
jgi:hypothetical protein